MVFRVVVVAAVAVFLGACSRSEADTTNSTAPLDLSSYDIIDLSYAYNDETVYWPTAPSRFEKTTIFEGENEHGEFYSAFSISTPEHGGTHLDAPYHFDRAGDKAEAVPLTKLMAPAVVIDIKDSAAAAPRYRLSVNDVIAFEASHGRIARGSIVLLRTGWSKFWPDAEAYLGGTDADDLAFPSFGEEAVRLLIEDRGAVALGVDSASTDYGPSDNFPVHRIMGSANVPGFENLTNLDQLPPTGATVIALPMKIEGGSGAPLRAVALVPKN